MRSLAFCGLFGALALLAAAAPLASCGGGSNHLTASVDVIDFGTVVHGENVVRTLRVTNEGRKGVVLTAATPSCKCLVVDPAFQRSLQPSESTEIRITLESGTVTPQSFEHKHLRVNSDDPDMPVLFVALKGAIVARWTVVPTMLRVGPDDAAGLGEARRIKVRTPEGSTLEILKQELSHPTWFTLAPEKVGGGVDLLLSVTPDPARRGPVDAVLKLTLRVSGRGLPPATTVVEVRIQGTW